MMFRSGGSTGSLSHSCRRMAGLVNNRTPMTVNPCTSQNIPIIDKPAYNCRIVQQFALMTVV